MYFARLKPVLQSLRFKLTLWNTLVVLLVAILALVSVREGLRFMLLRETDAVLREESQEIALLVEQNYPHMEPVFQELNRKAVVHLQHEWFAQLVNSRDVLLWASPTLPAALKGKSFGAMGTHKLQTIDDFRISQAYARSRPGGRTLVRVGSSTKFIQDDVDKVTRIAAPVAVAILLLAPIGGYALSGRATRPLKKIIATTEGLRPSRLQDRLLIRGTGDELDQLSQKINTFLDQIAEYLSHHFDFVANAAHELRSPLTAIQSSVDVALGRPRSVEEYENLLYSINEECGQLTTLVNQLLLLAESDAGFLELSTEPIALDQVLQRSLDMFAGVAEERGVELVADITPDSTVAGDAAKLRQLINNLLDNAIKFTPPGGSVLLGLRTCANQEVLLTVADTGAGIPTESLPRIFERFYQVDRARFRGQVDRGGGLGLSICQSIVSSHRGKISVQSTPGFGAMFTIVLPAAKASDPHAATSAPALNQH